MGKIVLVTGGARSGKSRFAERYAKSLGVDTIAYIATAQIFDEEMADRVKMHRERRAEGWRTYESPFDADKTIVEAATAHSVILFDCLTLYTTNLLLNERADDIAARRENVLRQAERLINAARTCDAVVIFVTNEVGMGIVPDNALSREYRDLSGWVNQMAAQAANEAYLVVCGLAVELKRLAVQWEGQNG